VVGKNRQTRKEREPFSNLPTLPVSEKLPRKKESENKENRRAKQDEKNGDDKKNKHKIKEGKSNKQKELKTISEKTVGKESESEPKNKIVELEGKKDLRKILEEKSKKYSHLPVYDKEEERRKAEARQAKMSGIFSDMDKQLESVTDLTSTHMAKKGITMKTSATPFDDPSEDNDPASEVHTIRYNKGVLNPRNSASQTQGIYEKDRTSIMSVSKTVTATDKGAKPAPNKEQQTEKVVPSVASGSKPEDGTEKSEEAAITPESSKNVSISAATAAEPIYALPPYKRNLVSPKPQLKDLSEKSEGATYESLGHTFRELTEKMQTVTKDMKDMKSEPEIPFMDDGDNEDYRQDVRKSTDLDPDMDTAISEVLAGCLDQAQQVEKIQLEIGPSSSSTSLMVSERKCQGTDTIHMSKSTLRRDYTDI